MARLPRGLLPAHRSDACGTSPGQRGCQSSWWRALKKVSLQFGVLDTRCTCTRSMCCNVGRGVEQPGEAPKPEGLRRHSVDTAAAVFSSAGNTCFICDAPDRILLMYILEF